jgi:hypothetical protein
VSVRYDSTAEAAAIAARTPYPEPPWILEGQWLWSVHPVRRSLAGAHLPAPLKPLWLPGGRTLGWSLIGQYGPGSTISYQEAACGLVLRLGLRPAIWMCGLVVDNQHSLAGGRNIWHLPKEMAEIIWPTPSRDRASAAQQGQLLLSFEGVPPQVQSLPLTSGLDILVVHEGRVRRIPARFSGRLGATRKLRPFFPASGAWAAFGVSGYSVSGMMQGRATIGPLEEA